MDALTQPIPLTLIVIAYLCVGKALLEWSKQQLPNKPIPWWKRTAMVVAWLPILVFYMVAPEKRDKGGHKPGCPRGAQETQEDAEEEKPTKPV